MNDSVILIAVSDLLINLSAGWFGIAIIVPLNVTKRKKRIWSLLVNIFFGIVSLVFAIALRGQL